MRHGAEASKHSQPRWIVSSEPPRHRQGRWIATWGASGGSLEALGHRQGRWIVILEAPRLSKSLPGGACGAPEHFKRPSDGPHGASVKLPGTPECDLQAFTQLSQQISEAFQASKLQFSHASSVGAAECAERLNNDDSNNNTDKK